MSICAEATVPERLPVDQSHRDRIVKVRDTNQFVEAGAGSGKTRALVDRVEALVLDDAIAKAPALAHRCARLPTLGCAPPERLRACGL